jgi:hypothetical protein
VSEVKVLPFIPMQDIPENSDALSERCSNELHGLVIHFESPRTVEIKAADNLVMQVFTRHMNRSPINKEYKRNQTLQR